MADFVFVGSGFPYVSFFGTKGVAPRSKIPDVEVKLKY